MSTKLKLIIAVALLGLAAIVIYLCVSSSTSGNEAATDAQNLEKLAQTQAPGAPPIKFDDLPAKPPSRGREATK